MEDGVAYSTRCVLLTKTAGGEGEGGRGTANSLCPQPHVVPSEMSLEVEISRNP